MWTILVHMRSTSLVAAKAHLSELVDEAEHRGKCVIILRHGKPAAAIVPVDLATAKPLARRRAVTEEQVERRFAKLIEECAGRDSISAVQDVLESRR